jgi:hypothetical protein
MSPSSLEKYQIREPLALSFTNKTFSSYWLSITQPTRLYMKTHMYLVLKNNIAN